MKIFIIGSNSFMGTSLISYLINNFKDKNIKIYGCSRSSKNHDFQINNIKKDFVFYKIDINKNTDDLIKILKTIKPNIIFNFAAQSIVEYSWKKPIHWFNTNLISNIKFLEYLKNVDYLDKYFQSSTPEVYGSTTKKISESFFYTPSTPYATSKSSIDMFLKNYFDTYKFPVIFTRVSNIYGPGQRLYKIIPKTIISLKKNIKLPLHGGGLSRRSFIYSDDVSDALSLLINKGKVGEVYHVTDENMLRVKDIVKLICKLMNKDYKKNVLITQDRPGKDLTYDMSSKKIKKLGWEPKHKINQGLSSTVNWIMNDYNLFKKHKLEYSHQS
tara:strand:+ start:16952 stop:17935 length:984 start_codon:yes stop_codon:yes gene_type:complete